MASVGTTFPRSRRSKLGYRVDEVENFLEEARLAYEADLPSGAPVSASRIRHMAFSMEKGGYSTLHVDAALERLEDAFALREREHAYKEAGNKAWFGDARTTAHEILQRLARPSGKKFARVGVFGQGYHRGDVDRFAERLQSYFEEGKPISVDEVRTVAFRPKKRGYDEMQVDLLLDTVVDVMLAVR